jgi:hypothetical protein
VSALGLEGPAAQHEAALCAGERPELVEKSRLADPRIAQEKDDARRCVVRRDSFEERALGLPTDDADVGPHLRGR